MSALSETQFKELTKNFRIDILEMITAAKSGHPGGSLSAIDLIAYLWLGEMTMGNNQSIDVKNPSLDRDRFVLSKGHGVPALYAVFAHLGYIERSELQTLRKLGSRLQGHPDRIRLPLVEASTGSLGQGLSVAMGLAMGQKMDQINKRVFCLLGDGEIQEGQVWEAALAAPKYKLDNLVVMLDANNGQIDGHVSEVMPLEPLGDKWRSFGWSVVEIDGHDFKSIQKGFLHAQNEYSQKTGKPTMILARTVKGKGVSFMENKIEWHGAAPSIDELERAKKEIRG